MPRHQNADLARRLQQRYAFDPPFVPDTIAPEIVPVSIVDQLLDAENLDLKMARGSGFSVAGGAGNYSFGGLVNPEGSGVKARVISCIVSPATSGFINLRFAKTVTGSGSYSTTLGYCDLSQIGTQPAILIDLNALIGGAHVGTQFGIIKVSSAGIQDLALGDIIIPPGAGFFAENSTTNDNLYVDFIWTEEPNA